MHRCLKSFLEQCFNGYLFKKRLLARRCQIEGRFEEICETRHPSEGNAGLPVKGLPEYAWSIPFLDKRLRHFEVFYTYIDVLTKT